MGEEEALHVPADVGERLDAMPGALIIEGDEDIVGNEGRWLELRRVAFDIGKPQGQVELVARSLAQAVDLDALAPDSLAYENGAIILIVNRGEAGAGASRERAEQIAGARQERVLRSLPVALDGRAEEERAELEHRPFARGRGQFAFRIASLRPRALGADTGFKPLLVSFLAVERREGLLALVIEPRTLSFEFRQPLLGELRTEARELGANRFLREAIGGAQQFVTLVAHGFFESRTC